MRRRFLPCAAVSMTLCAAMSSAARADDIEDLKRNQEELRRLVQSQQQEIDRLRANQARGGEGAGAEATALADMITELSKRPDGPVTWKQISRQGSKFTLYGFLRLDAQLDSSRPNSTNVPAWIRSEDAAAPASIGAPRNSRDFNMHPKLTRLGLDFTGPLVEALDDAQLTGKLETDFYNATGTSSRAALRIRHAYLKLAWDEFSILAGQTQDVISPLTPIVNNDLVMWGAGNLGDRRPQLRMEWAPNFDDTTLILQAMVGDTGADDGKDLDAAGTTGAGFLDGQTSGGPTWQARAAVRLKNWDDKNAEIGVWAHAAREDADTKFAGTSSFDSRAFGVDASTPLLDDQLWIKGELWTGTDLSDVRGGILQGVNTKVGREIDASGGWIELGFKVTKWLTLYAGHAIDNPRDADLSAGGVTGGRKLNRISYLASRMNFDAVEMGLEYLHWRTEFIGFGDGMDNRIVAYIAYKF